MDVTPLVKEGAQIVQSYSAGQFRVSGEIYQAPVLVLQDQTLVWDVAGFDALDAGHFQPLIDIADQIDVVLLGCGASIAFLKPDLKQALRTHGLSIDSMDTGAACRTFNVLMAEGRRVAAALLPV